MTRPRLLPLLLPSLVAGLALVPRAAAQAPQAPQAPQARDAVPIAELLDVNRDGRLDRAGDTVVVAGRASVASGVLYRGFLSVWIEDATGGVLLYERGRPGRIVEGDSVVARGVVTPYLGMSELVVDHYTVVPATPRRPTAVPVAVTPESMSARSGRLGTVEGTVVGWGSDVGGAYAVLRGRRGTANVALFISTGVVADIELAQYGPGDRIRATGIIVPYEPTDPRPGLPSVAYRIVPRSAADIELVGMSFVLRKAVALAMPMVLLAALVAVLTLRREVRRQTRRLHESEQRFRSLYAYSPDAIAEYDLAGNLRTGNAALAASTDLPLEQLAGTPMAMCAPPELAPALGEHCAAAARGETRRFEVPLLGRGGERATVDMTLLPIVVDGRVDGFYAIGKDVTERRAAQRELEASARMLAAIVETQQAIANTELDVRAVMTRIIELVPRVTAADIASVGIVDGDTIVMPNVQVGGAPLRIPMDGSLSGQAARTATTLRSDDAACDPRVHAEVQATLGFRSLIVVPLSYGGTTVGVLTVGSRAPRAFGERDERTLHLLAGQLAAALSHAREFEAKQELVAERTAALEALQASEERFRSIIEQSTDLVGIIDAQGVYQWVSPTSERVLGHPADSLVGTHALALIYPEDVPRVAATLARVVATPGASDMVEYRFRHLDGSWHVLETLGRNMLDHAAVRGIVVNSRDITEQRLLEEQLRHAQKMEAVGRLAGGIAHDFNNILTVIRVHSAFLLEAMADRDPRRVDAEEIQRASDRAAALTKQLLAFSRRQILQTRVIDLNEAIGGIEPMLRRLIGEDISFVTQLDAHLGQVSADVGQLEQVLLNLAVNARDAMPDGGTLTVRTHDVDLREPSPGLTLPAGRYALLEVTDTGVGMDEATQRRVFEPFFTTKEQGKGTGLGLATVYGVVEQTGGTVTVESAPGRGATFRVYLPCATEAEPGDATTVAVATPPRGTETILVVEDEDAVRSLTRRILGARGYRIIEARNGRDALDRARAAGEIDLVLTDVVMPEMGGRELAETLSRERPETRVLFMSGYTDDDILRRGLSAPGTGFLHKPFTVQELTESVRRTLDGAEGSSTA